MSLSSIGRLKNLYIQLKATNESLINNGSMAQRYKHFPHSIFME